MSTIQPLNVTFESWKDFDESAFIIARILGFVPPHSVYDAKMQSIFNTFGNSVVDTSHAVIDTLCNMGLLEVNSVGQFRWVEKSS